MTRKIPQFKRNEDVIFEVSPGGELPRWLLNRDLGYTGNYAEGIITEVTSIYISVDALYPDGEVRNMNFPNWESSDYETEQWWYPGYLMKINEPPTPCDCGYGNQSAVHWQFCPRWERL